MMMKTVPLLGLVLACLWLVDCQTFVSGNELQIVTNPSQSYDLQVSGLVFDVRDDQGKGRGLFSLTFNITDPWREGKKCHFTYVFQGSTVFPITFPCQDDMGLNVTSVGMYIAQFPNDTGNWTKANMEFDVWHDVTFQSSTFRKQAHVVVPDDVGGNAWTCQSPGYGGTRVVKCAVRMNGQIPSNALPTFSINTDGTIPSAPRGSQGDTL